MYEAARGDTWFGFHFGGAVPMGELRDWVAPGVEGGWRLTYMDREHAGPGLDLAYHRWGELDDVDFGPLEPYSGGWTYKLDAIQATAHVLVDFRPDAKTKPYLRLGTGLYWLRATLGSSGADGDQWQAEFGYNAGAGVNLVLAPARAIGLDATIHAYQDDDEQWFQHATVSLLSRLGSAK